MKKVLAIISLLFLFPVSAFSAVVRPTQIPEKRQIKIAYDGSSNPEYIGESLEPCADSEACWQIKKITYASSLPSTILYCNGTYDFTAVWDNRVTGCTYS